MNHCRKRNAHGYFMRAVHLTSDAQKAFMNAMYDITGSKTCEPGLNRYDVNNHIEVPVISRCLWWIMNYMGMSPENRMDSQLFEMRI